MTLVPPRDRCYIDDEVREDFTTRKIKQHRFYDYVNDPPALLDELNLNPGTVVRLGLPVTEFPSRRKRASQFM
ncbi:hypothetical protein WN48_08610 [Eufriesea mexicana]|uniref:Uncharacterized protein n=1 Tax=Eufriesea mexicana TaxID=516756 RepID=A0A310SIJ4_9HYME|nr:hypothetical protein WN48_08610 [Eufriesea mexicana]